MIIPQYHDDTMKHDSEVSDGYAVKATAYLEISVPFFHVFQGVVTNDHDA